MPRSPNPLFIVSDDSASYAISDWDVAPDQRRYHDPDSTGLKFELARL